MAKSRVAALTPREENEAFERAMAGEADKPRK
jgi:hypothetical protein